MGFNGVTSVIIIFIFSGINNYLINFSEKERLPYPLGFNICAKLAHTCIAIISIWNFGWIFGIIIYLLYFLNLINASYSWIITYILTAKALKEKREPQLNAGIYGLFLPLVLVILLFTVISFFTGSFGNIKDFIKDNEYKPVIVFLVGGVIGFIVRIVLIKDLAKNRMRKILKVFLMIFLWVIEYFIIFGVGSLLFHKPLIQVSFILFWIAVIVFISLCRLTWKIIWPRTSVKRDTQNRSEIALSGCDDARRIAKEMTEKYNFKLAHIILQEINNLSDDEIKRCTEKCKLHTPKAWIYLSFARLISNELETGKYHVYRGVLNTEGHDMYECFKDMMHELYRVGDKTEEAKVEAIKILEEKISYIG